MATVTIQYMRSAISDVYPSREWREKVNLMPENQVIAIYHNFLERGMFEKGPPKREVKAPEPVQLSIFDIMEETK